MRIVSKVAFIVLGSLLLASVAQADLLTTFTGSISSTDPTQLGRISRNSVPQTWADNEPYPGFINTSTTYWYHTYAVNVGATPFVEVTVDSIYTTTFLAAYLDSYDPTNPSATWLGDPGTSGNFWGTNPLSFQVYVPLHHQLILVANNTAVRGGGLNTPYTVIVQGFLDTQYTPTPEPSSLLLLGSGALGLAGVLRRKAASWLQ